MTQPTKPTPAMMPKREHKEAVQKLKTKRETNIARSAAPPRALTQRIGQLFPELKNL